MKLNLKLLATRFSQAEDESPVPEDGVNRYLLDNILRPTMSGDTLCLGDIDYDAFDEDDVFALEDYHERLARAAGLLGQFAQTVDHIPPTPKKARMFC